MGAVLRSPSSPGIVGRAAELGQLRSALAAARSAQPVTVLVGGEAGVGKTRLVAEFVAEATDASALVIVGQSVDIGGDGLPFGPVIGAVRDLVGQLGADVILEHAVRGARPWPGCSPSWALPPGRPTAPVGGCSRSSPAARTGRNRTHRGAGPRGSALGRRFHAHLLRFVATLRRLLRLSSHLPHDHQTPTARRHRNSAVDVGPKKPGIFRLPSSALASPTNYGSTGRVWDIGVVVALLRRPSPNNSEIGQP
jgi:hypothetical protein